MDTNTAVSPDAPNLADDLLRGADKIAEFLFGTTAERRKVYHLAETSRLPVFRLGAVLCARRSVLMRWIAEQEEISAHNARRVNAKVCATQSDP